MAALPAIPAKRYFTIGEVAELCDVKPYVLRYWEQEFSQLRPMKRRGNRRYYQHHEVLLVRRIRCLLYEEGFTISGARNRLAGEAPHRLHETSQQEPVQAPAQALMPPPVGHDDGHDDAPPAPAQHVCASPHLPTGLPQGLTTNKPGQHGPGHTEALSPSRPAPAPGESPCAPLDWHVIRRELEEIRDQLLR